MSQPLRIGLIGCGNISQAYLWLAPIFRGIQIVACADRLPEAAALRAQEYDIPSMQPEQLLAHPDIDLILNLTVPNAHFEVSMAALQAGKHVYSEKPFVLSVAEGQQLASLAASAGLRVGSAPDTFLGGAHQLARHLVDQDAVGAIRSGTCFVLNPGMEMWHPNPDFFFQPGGGPILDMGAYYLANLVQLLGPIRQVAALSSIGSAFRTISSEPRQGERIKVETPTTVHALLEFHSGATITFCASWDVWQHGHSNMELYGRKGSLHIPDPNFFGGELRITSGRDFFNGTPSWPHPFSRTNDGDRANYRIAGLADMANAILEGRAHRCSLELALHVVEVMSSIMQAGDERRYISMSTTCERPDALGIEQASALLALVD